MSKKISEALIVRYLSGECTQQEKLMIEKEMASDPLLKDMIDDFEKIWSVKREEVTVENIDSKWSEMKNIIQDEFRELSNMEEENISASSWIDWLKSLLASPAVSLKYAAAAVILIVAVFLMRDKIWNVQKTPVKYYTVTVPSGKRTSIILSDGTKVTLDACSKLKYPAVFGDVRDVYLEGEGFFEVTKDPDRPFRVYAGSAYVNVLGTKFNVRAWEGNPRVTVTVIEGKVLVSNNKTNSFNGVYLTMGEQSTVSTLGDVSLPVNVNAENYIKWMHNEIYFKDASLKEILSQLQRWYGYRFVIDDDIIANQTMTIHIRRANVDEVINIISSITKTEIIRTGKTIHFILKQKNAA